jgi:hypothetical protein
MDAGGEGSVFLLYDNVDGVRTGVAVANLAPLPASVDITAWDEDWNRLAWREMDLPARGHASFLLPDRLPGTAGRRGVVQFRAAGEGRIAGLSLLFPPGGRFTTTPKLPSLGR